MALERLGDSRETSDNTLLSTVWCFYDLHYYSSLASHCTYKFILVVLEK